MLLDFRKIFSIDTKPIDTKVSFNFEHEDCYGYMFKSPVDCEVKLEVLTTNVRLDISINAIVLSNCARCLDDIERSFAVERTFFIKNNEWIIDDPNGNDLPFTNSGKLDIKELVYCELVLYIPAVLICKEECEGLCPNCGKRKPQECTCKENEEIDERLLPLKQLLTD